MKVFLTGATGFVGTAVVQELLQAGHHVTGLARSEASAEKLKAAGAEFLKGDLQDLDSLRKGAENADAVIHAGFIHDFTRFAEMCEVDRVAIDTIGSVLEGSNRPFLVTSGSALVNPGNIATEDIMQDADPVWPRKSEPALHKFTSQGVRTSVIRLSPSVHGEGDHHGFIPILINIARQKGVVAYVGEGQNRWNAVHRLDAARLYRLALENGEAGKNYHAVGEEQVTLKAISEIIGSHLNLPVVSIAPEEAAGHFGWFALMAALDCPASSKITRESLKWEPTHPSLAHDLESGIYFN